MIKKYMADLSVVSNNDISEGYFLLTVQNHGPIPEIIPGQFVEIRIKGAENVMLRRPISIHDFDATSNTLCFLICKAGEGTKALSMVKKDDTIDVIFPLGNGFDISLAGKTPLLVGGGVGVAPLFLLAKELIRNGAKPTFLFGTRAASQLLCKEKYEAIAPLFVTTEDGSTGTKGFVTDHGCLSDMGIRGFSSIMQCGPTPMMKAVAQKAKKAGVDCYASLENTMACGIGVCLCCVTSTITGNKRVCADGPVFNVNDLKW